MVGLQQNFPEADTHFVYIKDQGILTLTWKPSIEEVFVVDGAGREDSGVGCWVM